MLFDLQGRRKTAVKAIYLGLAILMGGGLVLFGIGSNVNGGFADFLTGRTSNSSSSDAVNESAKRLAANPKNPKAYEDLIGDRYSLAGIGFNQKTQTFDTKAKQQLKMMTDEWKQYQKLTKKLGKKIDVNTANYVVTAYLGQEDAKGALKIQTMLARLEPNAGNYLTLMRFAIYASDSRITDASAIKARELATKDQIASVNREIKSLRKKAKDQNVALQKQLQQQFSQQQQQQSGGAGGAGSPFGGAGAGAGTSMGH